MKLFLFLTSSVLLYWFWHSHLLTQLDKLEDYNGCFFFFFHMNQLGYPTYDPNFNMFLFWAGGLRPLLSFSLFVCVCSICSCGLCVSACIDAWASACMHVHVFGCASVYDWVKPILISFFFPFLIGKKICIYIHCTCFQTT